MFYNANLYYVTLALQAVCVYHCVRKGNQNKWIWIIVCLPVIGCLIYFFSEIANRGNMQSASLNAGSLFSSGPSIKRLEIELRFSDTFQNRIALADACLAQGLTHKAIELYEGCRKGLFEDNEHLISQLIIAYANSNNYEAILPLARQIYHLPQFRRSAAHMNYAIALGQTGHTTEAEREFQSMNGRFSPFEPRYFYGLFLYRQGQQPRAVAQLQEMVNEYPHLGATEKRFNHRFYRGAKSELKKITTEVPSST